MKRAERLRLTLDYLRTVSPPTDTELDYKTPFQLLVAVILSAQCTDKRVNLVTPALFQAYGTPEAMAEAEVGDILAYIRSVSYPNSKACHLKAAACMIVSDFGGRVPCDFDQLLRLPGVGRKTANVVIAVGFGLPGLAVDTHVFRVSRRLRLVPSAANTPTKVEAALKAQIPQDDWAMSHFRLLYHGRYTCKALRPLCRQCGLSHLCPSRK